VNLDLYAFLVFLIPSLGVLIRFALVLWPEAALPDRMRVKKDAKFKPTVSVIIPCYNEGGPVYDSIKSIAESDYPAHLLSVYPQDDGSKDNSFGWMMKASYDFPNVFPKENPENWGKTLTYLDALDRSESEIVFILDSDTTVAPDAISKMVACFADARLGVVGAAVGVNNPNHSTLTAIQTQIYFLWMRLAKISENHFLGVSVIGGFALAIRRHLLNEIKPDILSRNWFGLTVKDGEDRFITHLALLRGWGSYVEQGAETRTAAMESYQRYFGQQMRWKRSMIRTFMWVVRTMPRQIKTINMAALFSLSATAFTLMIAFMYLLVSAITNPRVFIEASGILALAGTTAIFTVACLHISKLHDQRVYNPAKMILFPAWWLVNVLFLVVLSLLTLDSDAWGNREVKTEKI
jgi:cellulose synthase/poly-beta-1,6-N-acetylglucosamine synthase-like glycosyltransferase